MVIVVNDKQKLLSSTAINKAEKKAHAAFAKFGSNVKALEITVHDVNGPRGGVDKQCQVLVKLHKSKDIAVNVIDESLSRAIPSAINRASRSVARQLELRSMRGGGRVSRLSFEV